jgi:hypothetical protein
MKEEMKGEIFSGKKNVIYQEFGNDRPELGAIAP